MSLHARFLVLLGLLGVAVLASILVTVWSVRLLDREQRRPAEQIGLVLGTLNEVKRTLWDQAGEIGFFVHPDKIETLQPGEDRVFTPEEIERYHMLGARALSRLASLDEVEASLVRAGVNTATNLRVRIERVNEMGERYMLGKVPEEREAARVAAMDGLYYLHEFLGRLEARLLDEAQLSVDYAGRVQRRLMTTLAASVLSVLLTLATAAWLFRRWVILRIDQLRIAAERIGSGDFAHRVEVHGDDELDRVGRQLNEMMHTIVTMQAERIERERLAAVGEMARLLAHNIRNPLGGIRSLAELSEQECAADDPVREHQRRIIRTVDQFIRWLNDLLSISNPLSVEPAPEAIGPWIEGLLESHRPLAETRGAGLTLDLAEAPETAHFDRRHLEHAVSALLTNAIEVSPQGGEVRVTIARDEARGVWRLAVADEGPGIPEEILDSLFTPYFTTKRGGTGIGLAQAKRIVQQHGGRIGAKNRGTVQCAGSGAEFFLELSLDPEAKEATIGQ